MIAITDRPLDVAAIEATVARPGAGALLTFSGVARDNFDGQRVLALEYEAFAEMALSELAAIATEARARWPGLRLAMVHRTGRLRIGEASVVVAVSSPHRAMAYEASRFAIDALKVRVPVWKKEIYADGAAWRENAGWQEGAARA